ncbi:hypothetical protein [Conexibacter sp. DBS9H8]|uniref:hypothetical protein n=1 Tax=Conexibacter sp. DBS9H8 TaxID=2937801 RepID=UPI002010A5D4|nr:hypothetical protein [Conexibacter sp. DBS9H8]
MSAENRSIPVVESYFGEGVSPLLVGELIGSPHQISQRHHALRREERDGGRG